MAGREKEQEGRIRDAIQVDEVGIESGCYGPYLVKTAYQPIFAPGSRLLVPVAVEALPMVFQGGAAISWADFLTGIAGTDRGMVESLSLRLHLRNYANIGVDDVQLFIGCRRPADAWALAGRCEEAELSPELVVCLVGGTKPAELAAAVRARKIRVALDDFGLGHAASGLIEAVAPDMVRIEPALFRRMVRAPGAIRLLETLVAALKRGGFGVLVAGIETPAELQAAAMAGADLMQGPLLARPALAGTLLDMTPIDPQAHVEGEGDIAPPASARSRPSR